MTTITSDASVTAANRPRWGWIPAAASGAVLLLKAGLIIFSGNAIPASVQGVLYFGGLLLGVVAAAGIAARFSGVLPKIGVFLGIVVLFLICITMLFDGVELLVAPFTDAQHVIDEVPIAVAGLVWLLVGLRLRARD